MPMAAAIGAANEQMGVETAGPLPAQVDRLVGVPLDRMELSALCGRVPRAVLPLEA